MSEENRLLPCPFCGGEPRLQITLNKQLKTCYRYACQNDDCEATIERWTLSEEQARKKWNTRHKCP